MQNIKDKLIVALDVKTLKDAERFVKILIPAGIKHFKIGSQLFTAYGPKAVQMVGKRGGKVFLDLKFHDIPHTVFCATSSGTSCSYVAVAASCLHLKKDIEGSMQPPVFMMTVHTDGGEDMLKQAVAGAQSRAAELNIPKPFIVGVTKLTSDKNAIGTVEAVLARARLAKKSGLDGVVCASLEAAAVRNDCGKDFIIVTPGIRPKGADVADQKRVATAKDAISAGANYIVVGRPILEAPDPLEAAKNIIREME
jgi:orotidine-5'-phosphate decarboxylase